MIKIGDKIMLRENSELSLPSETGNFSIFLPNRIYTIKDILSYSQTGWDTNGGYLYEEEFDYYITHDDNWIDSRVFEKNFYSTRYLKLKQLMKI